MASGTVIGAIPTSIPLDYGAPTVELKYHWSDNWKFQPELEVISCGVHASSREISSCEILRRYGQTKYPFETDFTARAAENLRGAWIRVSITGEQGPSIQFVGQIEAPTRNLKGSATTAAGDQAWVAVGGLRLLRKMDVSDARSFDGTNLATIGWIPAMNSKDKRNLIVGNRSTNAYTNAAGLSFYAYGGKSTWTHRQYVDYLIGAFIQQYDDSGAKTGPVWSLGGQTSILDGMKTTIKFAEAGNVADMLSRLINPQYGVDWFVRHTDTGFQIVVFALTGEDVSFGGQSLPRNPNTITLQKSDAIDITEVRLVETTERRVDEIRVIGKRIVVCGTLRHTGGYTNGSSDGPETLTAKWSSTLEASYITAGGKASLATSDAEENDRIRKNEKYRDVYQLHGAPANWDLDGGIWCVACNNDGSITDEKELKEKAAKQGGTTVPHYSQVSIRETLSWIPLKEGFDYTTNPETDNTLADGTTEPQMKPPMAWILNDHPENGDAPVFESVEQHSMSVHAAQMDWGVFVSASPNHKLAKLVYTDSAGFDDSTDFAEYDAFDYNTLLATVAIESDHRLKLVYQVPSNLKAGDGSAMIIHDNEAECWVLLPGTTVDIGTDGVQVDSGDNRRILRNDKDRLALIMAGAIARYKNDRVRAVITFDSHVSFGNMIGHILETVQQGDDLTKVGGPITSVEWLCDPPRTIVRTGYA